MKKNPDLMSYSLRGSLSKALQAILTRGGGSLPFRLPATIWEPGTGKPVKSTRMSGRVVFDAEVISSLSHLWLSFITLHLWSICIKFMAGITFMAFITLNGDTGRTTLNREKKGYGLTAIWPNSDFVLYLSSTHTSGSWLHLLNVYDSHVSVIAGRLYGLLWGVYGRIGETI